MDEVSWGVYMPEQCRDAAASSVSAQTNHDSTCSLQDQRPPLPEDVQEWPIEEGVPGKAVIMRYKKEEQCWERLPEVDVTYSHPDSSGQV